MSALLRPVLAALVAGALGCGAGEAPAAGPRTTPLTTVTSRSGKLSIAAFTAPEQPPSRGTITVELRVSEARTGAPVEGLVIAIAPEMPSMGHGTPVVPRVRAMGTGTYLAEDVDLFMAGRWELRTTITGALTDDAIIPIDAR